MNFKNITGSEFAKDENFINDVINATKTLFHSNESVEIFKYNEHIVKAQAYTDKRGNHHIYLLEENKGLMAVYQAEVYSYSIKNGLPSMKSFFKSDVSYWKKQIEDKNDFDIYLSFVFKEESSNFKTNIPEDKIEEMLSMPNIREDMKQALLKIQELYKAPKEKGLAVTSSIKYMKNYINMLSELGLMQSPDEKFFNRISIPFTMQVKKINEEIVNTYKYLKEVSLKNNFNSRENAFEFNDCDNHVWVENDRLYLNSQNTCFECVEKDGFIKFFLLDVMCKDFTSEKERVQKILDERKLDMFNDLSLAIRDGEIFYADNALMECLWCDLKYSSLAFKEEGLGDVQYSEDIRSMEYQQKFMREKGFSKIDFLIYHFLTLGGGSNYDEGSKSLWDSGVFYQKMKDLPVETEEESKKINRNCIGYTLRDDIKELNDEWKEGLRFLLVTLKNSNERPLDFHYMKGVSQDKTKEDKFNIMIESIEKWFEKYDTKPVKKLNN